MAMGPGPKNRLRGYIQIDVHLAPGVALQESKTQQIFVMKFQVDGKH